MGSGSFVLRFVDVVLILLFGFISISEISEQSQIELPESTETPPSYPDIEEVVYIGITKDGKYLVEDETMEIRDTSELGQYLSRMKETYGNSESGIRIRIRSNYDAPIIYTKRAAQLCDELGIPKGMDVLLKGQSN